MYMYIHVHVHVHNYIYVLSSGLLMAKIQHNFEYNVYNVSRSAVATPYIGIEQV